MVLIIYDSTYGNTRKIAEAIAETFGANATCISIDNINGISVPCEFIIVGCPVNAWSPTPKIKTFLRQLTPHKLAGISAATFDTRLDFFFSGDASRKIAKGLRKAGAHVIASHAFYVKTMQGPLAEGQIERAKEWAESLVRQLSETTA